MRKLIACSFPLFLVAAVWAQSPSVTDSVKFTITSPAGSPVSLSALAMSCSEWKEGSVLRQQGSTTVTATNKSSRTIIAIAGTIQVSCLHGGTQKSAYHHDFYFKPAGFAPGDTWDIPVDINDGVDGASNATSASSTGSAAVAFVQFDDGTTWGDASVATTMLGMRSGVVSFLRQLASQSGDQSQFSALVADAIKGPPGSKQAVANHLQMLLTDSGLAATVANVQDRLNIAATRKY